MSENEIWDFDEEDEEEYSRFVIEDDKQAEWAMEKIKEAKENSSMWDAHFEGQKRRVHETNDRTIETMTTFLREYFDKVPHKITKTEENYRLPGGKLVLKHQKIDYERQEDELLDWVRMNHPEFIKRKESVDWDALKKTLKVAGTDVTDEDGVVIPCIKAVERPDIFTIGK